VGHLREGAPADFAIFHYASPTPADRENGMAHLIYGLGIAARARWVYARGEPVLEAGVLRCVDEDALITAARERARSLWRDALAME
jgi:cytosine/adenosine deaminase-related metal-dependent hydrolase